VSRRRRSRVGIEAGFDRIPSATAAVSLISWFESERNFLISSSNADLPFSLFVSPIFASATRHPVTMSLFFSVLSASKSAGTTLSRICWSVGLRLSLDLVFSPCQGKLSLPVLATSRVCRWDFRFR